MLATQSEGGGKWGTHRGGTARERFACGCVWVCVRVGVLAVALCAH